MLIISINKIITVVKRNKDWKGHGMRGNLNKFWVVEIGMLDEPIEKVTYGAMKWSQIGRGE